MKSAWWRRPWRKLLQLRGVSIFLFLFHHHFSSQTLMHFPRYVPRPSLRFIYSEWKAGNGSSSCIFTTRARSRRNSFTLQQLLLSRKTWLLNLKKNYTSLILLFFFFFIIIMIVVVGISINFELFCCFFPGILLEIIPSFKICNHRHEKRKRKRN